ncbi:hypothetical protein NP493_548g00022 [Ridgeia piscesae]|uniref:Uncharacterized protein n=1 Tax=Ridgeia piscesae TaxID=27915 RepID=A0AAD9KWZ1_RIDPI|nr:hypothetical protein NP493_548g00022 [Ridgeia piscesae]
MIPRCQAMLCSAGLVIGNTPRLRHIPPKELCLTHTQMRYTLYNTYTLVHAHTPVHLLLIAKVMQSPYWVRSTFDKGMPMLFCRMHSLRAALSMAKREIHGASKSICANPSPGLDQQRVTMSSN